MKRVTMTALVLPTMVLLACAAAGPAFAGGGGVDGDWEGGLYFGTAHPDSYDPLDPENGTLYGVRLGYFFTDRWSVEGSWQGFGTEGDVAGTSPEIDLRALRFNGLWNFRAEKKFRWFLTAGLGKEKVQSDDLDLSESELGWNWGGGARWYFGKQKNWGLRADARWIDVSGGDDIEDSQTNYEVTGGVFISFGGGTPPDSDSDHVPDNKDKCAGTPKGAAVDAAGCPKDSDADTVYDGVDKCPGTPRGAKVDASGCPADADGDGIADMVDKCPATPKDVKVKADGCPVEDKDGDGVWDGGDRCPDTPKGVMVDMVGCPMDADGDGVPDGADKCPNTPKGTKVDPTGCPAG